MYSRVLAVKVFEGCKFEHTILSIHLESFNDEWPIVKEAQEGRKSVESGIKTNAC